MTCIMKVNLFLCLMKTFNSPHEDRQAAANGYYYLALKRKKNIFEKKYTKTLKII